MNTAKTMISGFGAHRHLSPWERWKRRGCRSSVGMIPVFFRSDSMNLEHVSIGRNPPKEVNVIVEVPVGGEPIKYEMDKK